MSFSICCTYIVHSRAQKKSYKRKGHLAGALRVNVLNVSAPRAAHARKRNFRVSVAGGAAVRGGSKVRGVVLWR